MAFEMTTWKVMDMYVRHNSGFKRCMCRGCTDIRRIIDSYLKGILEP